MKKALKLISNPFILAIIPTLALILIIPIEHKRYSLLIERSTPIIENRYVWFDDLTLDGSSEKIEFGERDHFVDIRVFCHKGMIYNQWNLRGNLQFSSFNKPFILGDYNNNGKKEIYFFTLSNDSILLHIIDDISNESLKIRNRFISTVGPGKGTPDPFIISAEMEDLNGSGKKELIFGISTGFSVFPRNIFAYHIDNDSLIKSPESYYNIRSILQVDITGNGKREIILSGSAPANVSSDTAKYHDNSNWMMVLDQNLEFLFEPVEIPGRTNSYVPFSYKKNGKQLPAGILAAFRGGGPSSAFYFNNNGEVDSIIEIPGISASNSIVLYNNKEPYILLRNPEKGIFFYDFHVNSVYHLPDIYFDGKYLYTDLSNDGNKELFATHLSNGEVFVLSSGLKHTATANTDWSGINRKNLLSLVIKDNMPYRISLQHGNQHYLFKYEVNPKYYLSYSYYFAIYFVVLVFAMVTRIIQKNQIQKKHETEKKITELQLNLVKSQLNPHFTLNLINSVIHSIRNNKPDIAFDILNRFSRLNKNMLLSAESLQRTIKEELVFCIDYLELEKTRLNNSFDYEIIIDPDIDTNIKIPKMIIQGNAENSVKHGIFHKKNDGRITIEIKIIDNGLALIITDNGIGRLEAARQKTTSTGKGLKIMKDFYGLYNIYSKEKIDFNITDLFDENNQPSGTQVKIIISQKNEK